MPKRTLISLLVLTGLWGVAQPASGQALIPHVLQIDNEQLEQQGLLLAQEAAQLAQFQQYDLALARAQLASQLVPGNADIWALLGSLYLQSNQVDPAIEALMQSRALDRTNAAVLFALGSAYFQKEDYDRSIDYLQAGLQIESIPPETRIGALFDLGNAYYKLTQYEAAIAEYQKAIELDSQFWPAVNNIGLVMYEQGNKEGALQQWQQAVTISGEQAEPQLAIAVVLYEQGQTEAALAQGEAALQTDPRYADLEFLKQNLWGEQLLAATRVFLNQPQIVDLLARLGETPIAPELQP